MHARNSSSLDGSGGSGHRALVVSVPSHLSEPSRSHSMDNVDISRVQISRSITVCQRVSSRRYLWHPTGDLLDHKRSEYSKVAESHECITIFAPHLHAVGVFPSIRRTPCHNIRRFSESNAACGNAVYHERRHGNTMPLKKENEKMRNITAQSS